MTTLLLGALFTIPAAPVQPKVETLFVRVGPLPISSVNRDRAIVLIHGLSLHPFSKDKILRANQSKWQLPDSPLVKALARTADVYSLSYGQTVGVDQIAGDASVLNNLKRLQGDGYREIILIGHSAGGLIARHLIEDHPDIGVTKVIQVCSPNAGSGWAALKTATSAQMAFLVSLSRGVRKEAIEKRKKSIPKQIEFTCVVASCRMAGDGIVFSKSQWSPDLQAQGIPAHWLRTTHWDVMNHPKTLDLLARLVKEPQPRWDAKKVQSMRKTILP